MVVTIPPRKLNTVDAGDSTHIGSDDWDGLVDHLGRVQGYSSLIFKVGSTYYAIRNDGTLISSSATAETVIQAALDLKGDVYLSEGDYNLSAGFTGFTFPTETHLIGGYPHSKIRVNNGYSSYVFKIEDIHWLGAIDNIYIEEQGSPAKGYTAFKFKSQNGLSGTDGINGFHMNNVYVYKCNIGLDLETATTIDAYITACTFKNITIHGPKAAGVVMTEFTNAEISRNSFDNVVIEMDSDSLVGFKNISGTANMFINCIVFDAFDDTHPAGNIVSTAEDTLIIGGSLSGISAPFYDKGIRTQTFAPYLGVGPTNLTRPDVAKYGSWNGASGITAADGILNGRNSAIVVGTGTDTPGQDSTGTWRNIDTGATINSISGMRDNALFTVRSLKPYFKTAIYLNSVTNVRIFAGFVANAGNPASSADPLNALEGIGLWLDSDVSADWKIIHNNTAGASVVDALTTPVTAATSVLYPIEIFTNSTTSEFRVKFNNDNYKAYVNEIPGSTAGLTYRLYIENTTAASRTFRCYYVIVRTDK